MAVAVERCAMIGNRILAELPHREYQGLFSNLKLVRLNTGEVLYELEDQIRHAYFINNGMASLLSIIRDGDSIEVGMVGNEGLVGIPIIQRENKMPYRIVVQVPGDALIVRADILRQEFDKNGKLKDSLLRYTYALSIYSSQLCVCNHFHTLDERLCRWLLTTSDRVKSENLQITHELLSEMLGSSRTGVTMAATKLQRLGLIRYYRGKITILQRDGLEVITCECYRIIKEAFDHFLDSDLA
jgi:CRP-like cAMP-binding protein